MIPDFRRFWRFYLDLAFCIFFVFLAIQLLPVRGWDFTTIFCCVFATISAMNVIRLLTAQQRMRKIEEESYEFYQRLNEDAEVREELNNLLQSMEHAIRLQKERMKDSKDPFYDDWVEEEEDWDDEDDEEDDWDMEEDDASEAVDTHTALNNLSETNDSSDDTSPKENTPLSPEGTPSSSDDNGPKE